MNQGERDTRWDVDVADGYTGEALWRFEEGEVSRCLIAFRALYRVGEGRSRLLWRKNSARILVNFFLSLLIVSC